MAEVVEINWLDSWPETVHKEAGYHINTAEAYKMMTGMSEDKMEELNM